MGKMRNSYNMLVGKPEWRRPLGRPRHEREDNVRVELNRNRLGSCGLDSSDSG
jgi:hypothetical protein